LLGQWLIAEQQERLSAMAHLDSHVSCMTIWSYRHRIALSQPGDSKQPGLIWFIERESGNAGFSE
jgi:hypothetical protein